MSSKATLPFTGDQLAELGLSIDNAPSDFFVSHEGDGRTSTTLTRESLQRLVHQASKAIEYARSIDALFIVGTALIVGRELFNWLVHRC